MRVEKLMTKGCASVQPDATLNEAAHLMWKHDCGALPVVDDKKAVVGIVTDRDICMCAYHEGRSLKDLRVESAMSHQVVSCTPQDDVDDVQRKMSEVQIRRMPVVDERGRLDGILTLAQMARAGQEGRARAGVSQRAVGQTLAAICRKTEGPRAEA